MRTHRSTVARSAPYLQGDYLPPLAGERRRRRLLRITARAQTLGIEWRYAHRWAWLERLRAAREDRIWSVQRDAYWDHLESIGY